MSEQVLQDILDGIKLINKRMDTIEKMIFDLKIPEVDPTPEEVEIIKEYEEAKKNNKLNFEKLFQGNILEILITKKAKKQLESLEQSIRNSISAKLQELSIEGYNANLDIKRLKGYDNHYRLRVGEYRIRFEIVETSVISIYWIGIRSKAYKD